MITIVTQSFLRIEHIALWANDLELLREFYTKYFDVACGTKYTNPAKRFSSYFLTFGGGGARIELMAKPGVAGRASCCDMAGLAHFSVALGSREAVDSLTERLRRDGHTVLGEPRTTGDGYYESVVADPEGNRIELTV